VESLIVSFVTVVQEADPSDDDPVHFIVPRSRAYLAAFLAKAYAGRGDMEVIVDRRYVERRKGLGPAEWQEAERRSAERRRPKQEVIEVVIERPGPGEGREGPR
jgi:hypothetical protein